MNGGQKISKTCLRNTWMFPYRDENTQTYYQPGAAITRDRFSAFKRDLDGTIQLLSMVIDDVAMDATNGYLLSCHIYQIYSSV